MPDVDFPVLNVTMRVGNMIACDLYESCKKNPYVATLASGQSAIGFLEFMGSNAVQTGKVKISFSYENDEERALLKEMYPCDMNVNGTLDDYPVAPCTCNYCETSCKPSTIQAYPAFFDGFNLAVVAIVYACLIILSVIIHFVKKKWMNNPSDEGSSSTLDGEGESDEYFEASKKKALLVGINKSYSNGSSNKMDNSSLKI